MNSQHFESGSRLVAHCTDAILTGRPNQSLVTMRRTSFVLLLVSVLFLSIATSLSAAPPAAPRAQAALAVITYPEPFDALRGQVQIIGTAQHPQFQRYELYFKLEPGEDWVFIGDAHTIPVVDGVLGMWDTTSLPDGTYSLRLRVVKLDGNYEEGFARQVLVANAQPTETPTPEISPTPTDTPTPLPPTPTIEIELPSIPTATPRPTVAPVQGVEDDDGGSAGQTDDSGGFLGLSRLTGQIDAQEILSAFLMGIRYTIYAFAAMGAYLILKRVIVWLWGRVRG
jgi:hypothetical protein